MSTQTDIETFLAQTAFGVAGASTNRDKYGNKCLRAYLQDGREAYGVNPRADEIEGVPCFPTVSSLPDQVGALSIVTPPKITEEVVEEAAEHGIKYVWMQPGAESAHAVKRARELGLTVIAGGPCLLVAIGFRE